jgi:hypothetical protein
MSSAGILLAAAVFGWSCKSIDPLPVDLNVSVFESSQDMYQLHVVAIQGEPGHPVIHPLLKLQDVRAAMENGNLVYSGESRTAQAELSIRPIAGEIHLPSTLKLLREGTEPDDPLGANSDTPLVCTPTRNIDP